MKSIHRIAWTAALLFMVISSQAQRNGFKEITEKRIEFIASKLDLTANESEKFWPVFREFQDQREQFSKKMKLTNKQSDFNTQSTNEEYLNAINFMIESKIDQANLMKIYTKRYLEILPPEKVYKLFQLDEEFNKFLLNQLKGQGQGRRN